MSTDVEGGEMSAPTAEQVRLTPLDHATGGLPFALGWLLTCTLFFPGHVSGDTADAWFAATGDWEYTTWHPPMHAVLWSWLRWLWDSPASMLAFQSGLYWLSLFVIAQALWRWRGMRTHVYWIAVSMLPFVMNYLGALIKDTASAVCMLFAVALLVVERCSARRSWALSVAALTALLVGALMKYPALPMALPIAGYVAWRLAGHDDAKRARWFVAPVAAIGFVVVFALSSALVERAVSARQAHIENALYLYDLQGMSERSGESLLDEAVVPPEREREFVEACRDTREWDQLVWGRCAWVAANVYEVDGWNAGYLRGQWLDAVASHPGDYVGQRLAHVWSYQTAAGKAPFYLDRIDSRLPWQPEANALADGYQRAIDTLDGTPFFRPWFWTASSLAIVIWSVKLRRRSGVVLADLALSLGIAGLAFYLTLAGIGVAYEFRYSYTVVLFVTVATGLLAAEHRRMLRTSAAGDPDLSATDGRSGGVLGASEAGDQRPEAPNTEPQTDR